MDGKDLAVDRISDLPDPLIRQILSLLNPKEAVCTCILSKRWTNLWTSVATSDFDYDIFGYSFENKFMQFVRNVLNHRSFSPLDKFRLTWPSRITSDNGIVEECINHVVASMPRVINICIRKPIYLFNLSDSLFNCGSVKEMSLLGVNTFLDQPKSINLPSLQKLEFGHMLINDGFIRMLLLGCPVLEELVLTRCRLLIKEINSNVLKKLTTKKCYFSRYVTSFTLKNTSSLVTADLEFEILYGDPKLNLLGGLPNVTSLRLYTTSRHLLGLLKKDIPNCPTLNNLKSLELGELDTSYGWNLVACFLQHSPNLKKLVLGFCHSEVTAQEALLEKISFRREFLEMVEIRVKEESEESVSEVVRTLDALVKTIGKIIIL